MDGNPLASYAALCSVVVGALLWDAGGLVTLPALPRQAFEVALVGLVLGFVLYLFVPLIGRL